MTTPHRMQKQISSALTVIFFALQQIVLVPSVVRANEIEISAVKDSPVIEIPSEIGEIEKIVTAPGSAPSIIHIQDAHGNYDAQKNIRKILDYLNAHEGIDLVMLEGGKNALHPESLDFFPEKPELNLEIADRLAKQSELSGGEIFLLDKYQAKQSIASYGMENAPAYRANRESFQKVLRARRQSGGFLTDMDMQIDRLTAPLVNAQLKTFLRAYESFEMHLMDVTAWTTVLKEDASRHLGLDLEDVSNQKEWPMLVRYYRLHKIEPLMDRAAMEKEKKAFVNELKKYRAGKPVIEKFLSILDFPQDTAVSTMTPAQILSALETVTAALPHDFSFENYQHLKAFVQFTVIQQELQAEGLFNEMERLESALSQKLARTETEKELLGLFKDYRMLKKLFALELVRTDYESILKSGESLKPSSIAKRFSSVNKNKRVRDSRFTHLEEINSLYDLALAFYSGAIERDRLMADNVIKTMKETGKNRAAMVTGGFHAEGMKSYFESKGFSYVLISPRINEIGDNNAYVSAMLDEDPAFKKSQVGDILVVNGRSELRELGDERHITRKDAVIYRATREITSGMAAARQETRAVVEIPAPAAPEVSVYKVPSVRSESRIIGGITLQEIAQIGEGDRMGIVQIDAFPSWEKPRTVRLYGYKDSIEKLQQILASRHPMYKQMAGRKMTPDERKEMGFTWGQAAYYHHADLVYNAPRWVRILNWFLSWVAPFIDILERKWMLPSAARPLTLDFNTIRSESRSKVRLNLEALEGREVPAIIDLHQTTSIFVGNPAETFGVHVGDGIDVNNDGVADRVVGQGGKKHPNEILVLSGADNSTINTLHPFGNFQGGVDPVLYTGADGRAKIAVVASRGGGPHLKVIDYETGKVEISSYVAGNTFRGGLNLSVANVGGKPYLAVGVNTTGGPLVSIYDPSAAPGHRRIARFFAYSSAERFGVNVSLAEDPATGKMIAVTVPDTGGSAHVKVWDVKAHKMLAQTIVGPTSSRTGGRVETGDLNGDGKLEIAVSHDGRITILALENLQEVQNDLIPFEGFFGGVDLDMSLGYLTAMPGKGGSPRLVVYSTDLHLLPVPTGWTRTEGNTYFAWRAESTNDGNYRLELMDLRKPQERFGILEASNSSVRRAAIKVSVSAHSDKVTVVYADLGPGTRSAQIYNNPLLSRQTLTAAPNHISRLNFNYSDNQQSLFETVTFSGDILKIVNVSGNRGLRVKTADGQEISWSLSGTGYYRIFTNPQTGISVIKSDSPTGLIYFYDERTHNLAAYLLPTAQPASEIIDIFYHSATSVTIQFRDHKSYKINVTMPLPVPSTAVRTASNPDFYYNIENVSRDFVIYKKDGTRVATLERNTLIQGSGILAKGVPDVSPDGKHIVLAQVSRIFHTGYDDQQSFILVVDVQTGAAVRQIALESAVNQPLRDITGVAFVPGSSKVAKVSFSNRLSEYYDVTTGSRKDIIIEGNLQNITALSLERMRKLAEGAHGFGTGSVQAFIYRESSYAGFPAVEVFYRLTTPFSVSYVNAVITFDGAGNPLNIGYPGNPIAPELAFIVLGYEDIRNKYPDIGLADVKIKSMNINGENTPASQAFRIVYEIVTAQGLEEAKYNGLRKDNAGIWTYQISRVAEILSREITQQTLADVNTKLPASVTVSSSPNQTGTVQQTSSNTYSIQFGGNFISSAGVTLSYGNNYPLNLNGQEYQVIAVAGENHAISNGQAQPSRLTVRDLGGRSVSIDLPAYDAQGSVFYIPTSMFTGIDLSNIVSESIGWGGYNVTGSNLDLTFKSGFTNGIFTRPATLETLAEVNVPQTSNIMVSSSPNQTGSYTVNGGTVSVQFGSNFIYSAGVTFTFAPSSFSLTGQQYQIVALAGDNNAYQGGVPQPDILTVKDRSGHSASINLPGVVDAQQVFYIPTSLFTGIDLGDIASESIGWGGYNVTGSHINVTFESSPAVPSGWTRAASNPNYAFKIEDITPSGATTSTQVLRLQDLRNNHIQDLTQVSQNPSTHQVVLPGYDVTGENTPNGPVVIFGVNNTANGRGDVFIRRVIDPASSPSVLSGLLRSLTMNADNTLASIELTDSSMPPGIAAVYVLKLESVPALNTVRYISYAEIYSKIIPGSGLGVDADAPLVIASRRTETGGFLVNVYDAAAGANHLKYLQTINFGSDSNGAFTLQDAYTTPVGRQVVSVGIDADHFNKTVIMDVRNGLKLELDGAATGVSYNGNVATYTLRNQDGTTRQEVVDLDTVGYAPIPPGAIRFSNNPNFYAQIEDASTPLFSLQQYVIRKAGTNERVLTLIYSRHDGYYSGADTQAKGLDMTASGLLVYGYRREPYGSSPSNSIDVYNLNSSTVQFKGRITGPALPLYIKLTNTEIVNISGTDAIKATFLDSRDNSTQIFYYDPVTLAPRSEARLAAAQKVEQATTELQRRVIALWMDGIAIAGLVAVVQVSVSNPWAPFSQSQRAELAGALGMATRGTEKTIVITEPKAGVREQLLAALIETSGDVILLGVTDEGDLKAVEAINMQLRKAKRSEIRLAKTVDEAVAIAGRITGGKAVTLQAFVHADETGKWGEALAARKIRMRSMTTPMIKAALQAFAAVAARASAMLKITRRFASAA